MRFPRLASPEERERRRLNGALASGHRGVFSVPEAELPEGYVPPPAALGLSRTFPSSGWLRCRQCEARLARDPLCSDLAVLTLHWMSDHPERWFELHPEDAEYLGTPLPPDDECEGAP